MTLKPAAIALTACLLGLGAPAGGGAQAQTPTLKPFPLSGATPEEANSSEVKIAVTYQFFIEGSTQTMADQAALADQGRKHLYLMLAKECVVLKQTIAETCTIQRASVNAQLRQQSRSRENGVRISGSASYRIELKKDEGAKH